MARTSLITDSYPDFAPTSNLGPAKKAKYAPLTNHIGTPHYWSHLQLPQAPAPT